MALTQITFFERFVASILAQTKTITLRNNREADFIVGQIIPVSTYETNRQFATIRIDRITPVMFHQLSDHHAKQENMNLAELTQIISEIYPNTQQLYEISFSLIKHSKE